MKANSRHIRKSTNTLVHGHGSNSLKAVIHEILNHTVQTNQDYYRNLKRGERLAKGRMDLRKLKASHKGEKPPGAPGRYLQLNYPIGFLWSSVVIDNVKSATYSY